MAQLDQPILPAVLYRYRPLRDDSIDREIQAIKQQYLWFSRYDGLNDPMAGFYEPTKRVQQEDDYTRLAKDVVDAKAHVGICCLSDTNDNELMWTHYASNYFGICIGYLPPKLLKGLPQEVHLVRLGYGHGPPSVNLTEFKKVSEAAIKILSHKKSNWVYEREWRLLSPSEAAIPEKGARVDIAEEKCVSELYFGSRIDEAHRTTLLEQLADTPIKISEMQVSGYTHEFRQLKPKIVQPA